MSEVEPLRVLLALAGVLATLAVGVWLVQRLPRLLPGRQAGAGRLATLETRWLDPRTRLVLVRCDQREHLLLLGGSGALVVDSRPAGGQGVA